MLARLIHSLWREGNPLKAPPPRPPPRPSTLLACFDGAVAGYSPSIADQQPAGSAQQHGGPKCSHQPCTRDGQGGQRCGDSHGTWEHRGRAQQAHTIA